MGRSSPCTLPPEPRRREQYRCLFFVLFFDSAMFISRPPSSTTCAHRRVRLPSRFFNRLRCGVWAVGRAGVFLTCVAHALDLYLSPATPRSLYRTPRTLAHPPHALLTCFTPRSAHICVVHSVHAGIYCPSAAVCRSREHMLTVDSRRPNLSGVFFPTLGADVRPCGAHHLVL